MAREGPNQARGEVVTSSKPPRHDSRRGGTAPVKGPLALPYLSPSVRERQYRLSGKCPPRAYGFMLLGLLLSPVSTLVAWIAFAFLLVVMAIVVVLITVLPLIITQLVAILIVLVMALLVVVSPLIIGFVVGIVEASIGRLGKCRSPAIGAIMGAIAGFSGLAISVGLLFAASIIIMVIQDGIPGTSDPLSAFVGGVMIASCSGVLFAPGGAIGGYLMIKEGVFCEECGEWYGEWIPTVGFGIGILLPLARALNEKLDQPGDDAEEILEGIEEVGRPVGGQYPRVVVKTRRCPNCPGADVQWQVTVNWEKGKSEEWFMLMLPAEFSRRLEKQLFPRVG